MADALRFVDQLFSQFKDLQICLAVINKFTARIRSAPREHTLMIQVDLLVTTLTEAVLTFSELEALVTPLQDGVALWNDSTRVFFIHLLNIV